MLVVSEGGEVTGEARRGGLACQVSGLGCRYAGAGWWVVTDQESGWVWVAMVGGPELVPGRYKGRLVPKGLTPFEAIRRAGGVADYAVGLPEFRTLPAYGGEVAYFEARHWRGLPAHTVQAARDDWEAFGREEWARTGWTIEAEKRAGGEQAREIMEAVTLECGDSWGEIVKSWVRRGRTFPHPWGEGMRAWTRERLRRADPLGGFEV